ncbi:hypothetical protein KCP76_07925 [Salmonella enterica subsp. enterica serovar Weltevreden]|nr:hypothetical protein KCP76_07925 [Salmonella enterica subsp. enterica serovar Weltevreden]
MASQRRFSVWAPNARRVFGCQGNSTIGMGVATPMRLREGGIWELFIPGAPMDNCIEVRGCLMRTVITAH